ncbi:MAG: transporter substrate-binding domain-containing protein [bacterium]
MNTRMKHVSVCLFILLIFPIFAHGQTLKMGYLSLMPHIIVEKGNHTGALVDYWEKHVAPAMGVRVEWVGPLPPNRLFQALEKGQINAIAFLGKSKARAEIYDYPEQSFYSSTSGIAVLNSYPDSKISSIDELIQFKIGYFSKGVKPPLMQDKRIKWDYVASADWKKVNFNKLVAGRIGGVFDAEFYTLKYEMEKLGFADRLKAIRIDGTPFVAYPVFSKKDNGLFVNKYNAVFQTVDQQTKYLDLLLKYVN